MTDISKLRRLVGGIPTTIDLTASGNILQAFNFQIINAGIDASLPLKLDGDKKFASGLISLSTEVTGSLPDSNLAQITTTSKVAGSAVVLSASGGLRDNSGLALKLDGPTLITSASGTKVADGQIDTIQLASGAATVDKIDIDGDLNVNNHKIVSLASPGDDATAATNKAYVDNAVTGIYWRQPVLALVTTASLPGSPDEGDRYLVTDSSNANKIATYGSAGWAYVAPAANWAVIASDTDAGYTYDADSGATFKWVQFSGAGQINAGIGLAKDGNTLSVLLGAGIMELPTHEVGIDLATNSGLELTSSSAGGQLQVAATLAGDGLTYAAGVMAVGAGDGITVASDSISVDASDLAGEGLTTDASNNLKLDSSIAGNGLTYSSGVLAVGAGEGLTVASDSIGLDSSVAGDGLSYTSGVLAVGAGAGLTAASDSISVGAGDGITVASDSISVDAGAGITVDSNGVAIDLDGSSLTIGTDGLKVNADGVNGSMIRLANNEYLRARNAGNDGDVNILKVNASDIIEFASFPITPSAAPDADYEVSNKKYVDDSIVLATPEKFQYKDQAAGEAFAANSTFVVRWALNGETAGRVYKATKDQQNNPDKYWGIGVLQTTASSLAAGDLCAVVKKGKLNLKSADTNFGASDNGKPIFLSTGGTFGTTSPETGVGSGDLYVSFIVGHVVSRSDTLTSTVFEVDCNPGGLMGIDIA